MKKSLLAIALAVVMTPFVFAAQTTGAAAGQPAATKNAKVKKATKATKKAAKKGTKGTKAAAAKPAPTTPQK
ncbi:MAG: hypothetical protein ABSF25_18285 [Bryobacteraceae bacterium]|jgi:hypothetical protein